MYSVSAGYRSPRRADHFDYHSRHFTVQTLGANPMKIYIVKLPRSFAWILGRKNAKAGNHHSTHRHTRKKTAFR